MVSDMGGQNQALWKSLGVDSDTHYFMNPVYDRYVYVFADAPHLLKLGRNNFLDYGFQLPDNQLADSSALKEILEKTAGGDLATAFRLNEHLLHVKGSERQRVKWAAKLLSESVGKS